MAEEPASPAIDWQKLKDAYSKAKSKHYGLISRLEEPLDREYVAKFTAKDGTQVASISFRKLNHGEIDLIFRLPFIGKLVSQIELSADEQTKFDLLKMDLLDNHAVLPQSKPIWDSLKGEKKIVDGLWANVHYASGMDERTAEQLDEFTTDEFGFTYGAVAFLLAHRFPSELGALSEMDITFANLWFKKWGEAVKKK